MSVNCEVIHSRSQIQSMYLNLASLTEAINTEDCSSLFLIIYLYFVSCLNCVCEHISETTVCQVYEKKGNAYVAQSKTSRRQETILVVVNNK